MTVLMDEKPGCLGAGSPVIFFLAALIAREHEKADLVAGAHQAGTINP